MISPADVHSSPAPSVLCPEKKKLADPHFDVCKCLFVITD
jgi:hypothetical protein